MIYLPRLLLVLLISLIAQSSWAAFSFSPNIWIHDNLLLLPKAGNLKSDYTHFAFSGESLALGSAVLPLPLELAKERGPVLFNPLPSYSHRAGLSEWGRGFEAALSIYRYSDMGQVSCQGNSFASPWGKLVLSETPGVYYPKGLEVDMRVVQGDDGFIAYHPDGRVFYFGKENTFNRAGQIFSWFLYEVKDKEGHTTVLTYEKNVFGRPLLKTLRYGGKKVAQYEVEFKYQALPVPVLSYGSCGLETTVDKRVSEISLKNWDGKQFQVSKTMHLTHDNLQKSSIFYLVKIETKFPSGEKLPAIHYQYDGFEKFLDKPYKMVKNNYLNLVRGLNNQQFFSNSMGLVDFNQDGLVDIERADSLQSYLQTPEGQFVPYADYSKNHDDRCGPSAMYNQMGSYALPRRLLIRPSGLQDDLHHLLLVNEHNENGTLTKIILCSLEGKLRYGKEVFVKMQRGYSFKDFTHLTDLNGDFKPDLVRVANGVYTYFLNESRTGEIRFADGVTKSLPQVNDLYTKAFTFSDINSDGFIDLVAKVKGGIFVWYGKGDQVFGPKEIYYPFEFESGKSIIMAKVDLTFVDINRDGLMDAVVHRDFNGFLFMNQGNVFRYARSAGLLARPEHSQYPRVFNLSGTADDQLTMFGNKAGLIAYDLNEAATGLLTRVDNGQGVVLDFAYQWTASFVGVPRHFIVPASLTVSSSGQGSQKSSFQFFEPKINPVNAELIGFGRVETTGPQTFARSNFLTDIRHQPKVTESTQQDLRVSHVIDRESHRWQASMLNGVYYPELVQTVSSYVQNKISLLRYSLDFLEHDRRCPTRIKKTTAAGILENLLSYFVSPDWSAHHACLTNNETLVAAHDKNPALDFSYTTYTTRNDAGLATDLSLFTSSKNISQTKFAYDNNNILQSTSQASTGKTFLHYDPVFEILKSLQYADGTTQEMTGYAAQADGLSGLAMRHGDGADFIQEFAFDGFHRLHKTWDNFRESSATQPLSHYTYRLANETVPSLITMFSQTAVGGYAQVVSLASADGQELTTVKENNDGWYFSKLNRQIPTEYKVQEVNLDHLQKNPDEIRFIDLDAANNTLTETASSQLWGMLDRWTAVSDEHRNRMLRNVEMDTRGIQVVSVENNQYATHALLDLQEGKPVSYSDETGRSYDFERDLLGRIRQISLPGQINHTIDFDAFGRVAKICRTHIGEILYSYEEERNLLSQKNHYDSQGQWLRQESYVYDAAGRMTSRIHKDKNAQETYAFAYDGQGVQEKGQRGFLSQIEHNHFIKKSVYAADGQAKNKNFADKKGTSFQVAFKYNRVRDLAEQTVAYQSGKNTSLSYKKQFAYDAYGQLKSIGIAGELLEIERNRLGKIARVLFPDGKVLQVDYDLLTSGRKGYLLHDPKPGKKQTSYHWNFNDRGLINDIEFSSSGYSFAYYPDKMLRTHFSGYRPLQEWAYDKRGLAPPNRTSDLLFNHAGSLIAKNKQHYQLGPEGRIASFQADRGQINYTYDEDLYRIGKYRNDALEYVRFEGLIGTPTHVYEKLSLEGVDIGFLVDGHFRFALFDQVGSLIATDNFFSMPSPFGERDVSFELQEHFDFATHGRDKDTGFISMGVRDYDPEQHRFISADPFLLEDLDACAASPIDCDLYSYARNNPLLYVDYNGQNPVMIAAFALVVAYDAIQVYRDPSVANFISLGVDLSGGVVASALSKAAKAEKVVAGASGASRAGFEKLQQVYREQMAKPHVENPKLFNMVKKLYRPEASIGSGSTAAAIRNEIITGKPTKGTWHSQKGEDSIRFLEKWLGNNPAVRTGDRAAAENIIKDTLDALNTRK